MLPGSAAVSLIWFDLVPKLQLGSVLMIRSSGIEEDEVERRIAEKLQEMGIELFDMP
jgi:3-hydroxyisobutyrate dehydrogenase-like beta-hydroxyacid dehydrogenase